MAAKQILDDFDDVIVEHIPTLRLLPSSYKSAGVIIVEGDSWIDAIEPLESSSFTTESLCISD